MESGGHRAVDDRMLPKFAKSREDDTSILSSPNSAPFRFRSRRSSRSREKFARRSGVALRARSRSWHRRQPPLFSPRAFTHVATLPVPDIVHPCLAIMASAHRDSRCRRRRRLLSPTRPIISSRTTETPPPCVASDSHGTCFDSEAETVVTV